MAKSKWMVSSQILSGKRQYIAYRMLDTSEPDHSGNREYRGDYTTDRAGVEALVQYLNDKEAGL